MQVAEVLKPRACSHLEERMQAGRKALVFGSACLALGICVEEGKNLHATDNLPRVQTHIHWECFPKEKGGRAAAATLYLGATCVVLLSNTIRVKQQ